MAELKTYSISGDITLQGVNSSKLHSELDASGTITNFDGIIVNGDELIVTGDSIVNEPNLDTAIADHDPIALAYPRILDLVNPEIKKKDFRDINYMTELIDGVKLHAVHTIGDSGLIDKTDYYHNYVDAGNPGDKVLEVTEIYVTHADDAALNPTARRVISRTKTREWVMTDDTLSNTTKVTAKIYDTGRKRNIEGVRRRDNIVNILAEHTALAGILSGTFTDENDANDKIVAVM